MKTVHWIALILVIIGALNWGLVGLFDFDLVAAIFGGEDAVLSRVIYSIVGLAGIVLAATSAALMNKETHHEHVDRREAPATGRTTATMPR